MSNIKFVLNGCDILFVAEAPEDITLKQLLKQTDKIFPDYCACGICTMQRSYCDDDSPVEIFIDYDSIRKTDDSVPCDIRENWCSEQGETYDR